MAAPAFRSFARLTENTAANAAVPVPSGVAADDVILVHIYKEGTAAVTPPAGFTEITPARTATNITHHLFWKRATGADTGTYTFTWTGTLWREAVASAYSGCVTTGSPLDTGTGAPVSAGRTTNASSTPAVSLTPTAAGTGRMIVWSGTAVNGATFTTPSGFTLRTSGLIWQALATLSQSSAAATGSVTGATSSSGEGTAWLVALLPTDAAATTASVADTATATDAVTVVDLLGSIDDTATATDAITTLDADFTPTSDTASATDAIVSVVDLITIADTATATDAVTMADTTTVIADTGTAADVFNVGDTAFLSGSDSATASDLVGIVDIYPSRLLPERPGPVYEVVVMAKIPAINAAPTFVEVGPIMWQTIDYTTELSVPQSLDLTCPISTLPESILQRFRRPHALATELWVKRDGQIVFAGPLTGGRREGETLTLNAAGLLAYLYRMVVYADLVFAQADQMTILKALIDHWQGRPFGNYGIDTSTVGTSGVLRDATYLKTELHRVLQRAQELGKRANGFDFDVDPQSRALQIWYPQRGVDRSVGEDQVVFDATSIQNTSLMFSVSPDDVATDAFGTGTSSDGGGTLYGAATNADLAAQYGATGITGTWDSVSEQPTLDAHVQALLDARGSTLFVPGPNVKVTPSSDLSKYDPGDTVKFDVDDQLGVTGGFRLRSIKVSVSPDGGTELVTPGFV